MSKPVAGQAANNSKTAQSLATGYNGDASTTGGVLSPLLTRIATNPQGYSAQDLADMNTAAQQGFGGATSGVVGLADQTTARTNNAGGFGAALDQSARDNAAGLSQAALGVQNANAGVKLQHEQEGINGLQQLYGTQVGAGENALGLSNQSLGVENTADQQTLSQIMAPFQIASSLAGGAGSILQGINH